MAASRQRVTPFVFKSAQESAFVFLSDERVRLLMLLDSIEHMGYRYAMRETRRMVEARLAELSVTETNRGETP